MGHNGQTLIPLVAAAMLVQMLTSAPLPLEALTAAFAPAAPVAALASPVAAPDDDAPIGAPPMGAPMALSMEELDPYDCFCGAN